MDNSNTTSISSIAVDLVFFTEVLAQNVEKNRNVNRQAIFEKIYGIRRFMERLAIGDDANKRIERVLANLRSLAQRDFCPTRARVSVSDVLPLIDESDRVALREMYPTSIVSVTQLAA